MGRFVALVVLTLAALAAGLVAPVGAVALETQYDKAPYVCGAGYDPLVGEPLIDSVAGASAISANLSGLSSASEGPVRTWPVLRQPIDLVAPTSAGLADELVYPPNRGFYGDPIDVTLDRGVVIDRHGSRYGTFVSPEGTPFPQRSLPQSSLDAPYEAFEVVRPIPGARAGVVEPWFDQPGWGVQYELPASVQSLIDDGYLVPVKP